MLAKKIYKYEIKYINMQTTSKPTHNYQYYFIFMML